MFKIAFSILFHILTIASSLHAANPICSGALRFGRPDAISVSVNISLPINLPGLCKVSMVQYNEYAFENEIVETGPCWSNFVFSSDRENLSMPDFTNTGFQWSYLYDNNTPVCTSAIMPFNNIGGPSCFQGLSIVSETLRGVFLEITAPRPIDGFCYLVVQSCGNQSANATIEFPSCSEAVEITLPVIDSVFPSVKAGQSCVLSWGYSYGVDPCLSGSYLETPPLKASCLLGSSNSSGGEFILSPILPESLPFPSGSCEVSLIACGGQYVAPGIVKTIQNCSDPTKTVTFNYTDTPAIVPGVVCTFNLTHSANACVSGPFSFIAATVPSWKNPTYTVALVRSDCLFFTWARADEDGGSPVLCYRVWRSDEGEAFHLIQDCGGNLPGSFSVTTCDVANVSFKVEAINAVGVSSEPLITTEPIELSFFTVCPTAVLVSPASEGPYSSAAFPEIKVKAPDNTTSNRIFVAQLNGRTGIRFTNVLSGIGGGMYALVYSDFVPSGVYSLEVFSLEGDGLLAQYWPNAFFQGSPLIERKEAVVDSNWTLTPVFSLNGDTFYDLVTVRWTGFVFTRFYQIYTFTLLTEQYVKLYIHGMLIIDSWGSRCPGSCSGSIELSGDAFASVQIDLLVSKGFDQYPPAGIQLIWSSFSQRTEIVPAGNLFRAVLANNGSVQPIEIVHDVTSTPNALVFVEPVLVAGSEGYVYIQSRDEFDQNVTVTTDVYSVTIYPFNFPYPATTTTAVPSQVAGLYVAPFSLDLVGNYSITVMDSIGTVAPTAELVVTVIPAEVYSVSVPSLNVPLVKIAGIPIQLSMALLDRYGNNVSIGSVNVMANWLFDDVSIERLGSSNDELDRKDLLGTLFFGNFSSYDAHSGLFNVQIVLPMAGTFSAQLNVPESFSGSLALPQWTVIAQSQVDPFKSVLITPPDAIAFMAGGVSSVSVQLRDVFGNCIETSPEGLTPPAPVRALLTAYPNVIEQTACEADPQLLGMYLCDITPNKAGISIVFTVQVNGVNINFVPDQSGGPVPAVPGPWLVSVSPSSIDPGNCLLTGLLSSYRVSSVSESTLILTLRDAFGNDIDCASTSHLPPITAKFLRSDDSVACTIASASYVIETNVNIPVSCTLESPPDQSDADFFGWTLHVSIAGYPVPVPAFPVRFLQGPVSYANSTCGSYLSTQTAGVPFSVTCELFDAFGNPVVSSSLEIGIRFSSANQVLSFACSFTGTNFVSTQTLNAAGSYTVTAILAQPGGLVAQYYRDSSFSQLLYPGTVPNTEGSRTFTQIDPLLELDYEGPAVIAGSNAVSIVWSGSLLPPSAETVRFHVQVLGGLQITLANSLVANYPPGSYSESFFDFSFLTTYAVPIRIEYLPDVDVLFKLKWAYPGLSGVPFSIPSSALLSLVSIPLSVPNPIRVFPATQVISALSFAHIPTTPFIVGVTQFIILQGRDSFGNNLESSSACIYSGAPPPACLFAIYLSIPDGSPSPTIVDLNNGQYRIDFTFATSSHKTLNIDLITGPAPADQVPISGSPYSIPITG